MAKTLFWVDLEMTGLDETTDHILEVAVIVTDIEFKPLEEYHCIVYQPPAVLDAMNDWCKKTHGESGLTAACATGKPLAEVENELLAMVGRRFGATDRVVLAGNSVGNDKRFIDRYMKELAKRLHYRLVDVSSYKEIFRDKYGLQFQKPNAHRAVDDIRQSIAELSFYLAHVKVP